MPPTNHNQNVDLQHLFRLVSNSGEDAFLNIDDNTLKTFMNEKLAGETLLHRAAEKGLLRATKKLLDLPGIEKQEQDNYEETPVEKAALSGYFKVFQMYLNDQEIIIPDKLLIKLFIYIDQPSYPKIKTKNSSESKQQRKNKSNNKCIELWFEKCDSINVNVRNKSKSTPLHYAAKYAGTEMILLLLRRNALLTIKNDEDVQPIHIIDSKTLKIHFDECINIKRSNGNTYKLIYDYTTLIPNLNIDDSTDYTISMPNSNSNDDTVTEIEDTVTKIEDTVTEIETIFYISQSGRLKELVMHPLIRKFVNDKWEKSLPFLLISSCYFILLYLLSMYSVLKEPDLASLFYFPWSLLFISEILVLVPNVRSKHFTSLQILTKAVLPSLLIIFWFSNFLVHQMKGKYIIEYKEWLMALSTIFSTCNILFLLSRCSSLGLYITIWYTVLWTYLKFLPIFIIPFVSFSLIFYIIFKLTAYGVFETFLLLLGNSEIINSKDLSLLGNVMYIIFGFLMVIVLLNVMNGLAVHDTQLIINRAEIENKVIQIGYIFYLENLYREISNLLPKCKDFEKHIMLFLESNQWDYVLEENVNFKGPITRFESNKNKMMMQSLEIIKARSCKT